jgi:hypothetical protein
MKKTAIISAIAAVFSLGMGSAYADGATVTKEFGCVIISADSGLSADVFTTESHTVTTPSGNTNFICHFEVPEALQGEVGKGTIKNQGFGCGTLAGFTTNTKAVTNKNRILLVCSI